jgi:hypothetical protein
MPLPSDAITGSMSRSLIKPENKPADSRRPAGVFFSVWPELYTLISWVKASFAATKSATASPPGNAIFG